MNVAPSRLRTHAMPRRLLRPAGPRAFTLVEVMLSVVVMSIILAVVGSAMRLMLQGQRAAPNVATQAAGARRAVDRVIDDLKLALAVPEATANALTVTVPDRNGDGQVETIRYAWSGTSGAPLTCSLNGGAAVSIADGVTAVSFQTLTKTVGPPIPPPATESDEQELIKYTSLLISGYAVKNTNWPSEYFRPSLPADATAWKITRVRLLLKRLVNSTAFTVSIYAADNARKPTGSPLETVTLNTATLSATGNGAWVDVPFSTMSNLSPTTGYCVVVSAAASTAPVQAAYDGLVLLPTPNTGYSQTTNTGGSWSNVVTNRSLHFSVHGTVTTQSQ